MNQNLTVGIQNYTAIDCRFVVNQNLTVGITNYTALSRYSAVGTGNLSYKGWLNTKFNKIKEKK